MQRSSQEYKDANELWELFLQTKARIFDTLDEVVNDNKAKIILKVGKLASSSDEYYLLLLFRSKQIDLLIVFLS